MEICREDLCTGCQLCMNVCAKKAISFSENVDGFLHPVIDENLCVNCGRCVKLCPINIKYDNNKKPLHVYAAWIKNKTIKNRSTSGGLFFQLASKIIEQDGVVFGAAFDSLTVVHSNCSTIQELSKFQGSKYVQSKIGDSYKLVKTLLLANKKVLFSGTPCQIAALKSYLPKKDFPNLYLIDLVCHGVPNARVFSNYLHELEVKFKQELTNVRFRVKTPDCYTSSMLYSFADGRKIRNSFATDPYSSLFVANYLIRKSCFSCKFSNTSRVSDITLADFWGYKPNRFRFRNYMKGINMVMVNTEKGSLLFNSIQENLVYEERPLKEAIRGNRNLSAPQIQPEHYEKFWTDYRKDCSLYKLRDKYLPNLQAYPPFYKRYIKSYLRTLLPKSIIQEIKKIKNKR